MCNMKTIRQINTLTLMLLGMFGMLASCDRNVHSDEDRGGLSVALSWLDDTDRSTVVNDIHIWIFNASDGSLVLEKSETDVRNVANQRFTLNEGDYKVVVSVNLITPFVVEHASGAAVNYRDMLFALSSSSASPQHAFWGVADVNIANKSDFYLARIALKRIMAELTITIDGVPEGVVLGGTVSNVATGIFACRDNGLSEYGLPANTMAEATVPETKAQGTMLATEILRLMPTASGQKHSFLHLWIKAPDGRMEKYFMKSPLMKSAGKYHVNLKYSEMRPYMYLSLSTVEKWREGWTYNGDIFDPE